MQIVNSNDQLSEIVDSWRLAGEIIGFVPTMGNLHQGHLKLISSAKLQAQRIVVSIFVNPLQFAPGSDFDNYPRTLEDDVNSLHALAVDLLYCPEETSIYPQGMENSTKLTVPTLSTIMCGRFRPGHFEGVVTVVAKLFNLVRPHVAVFGEKDYQQLAIIRKMVNDINFPVKIVGVETQRDKNGLALSSRNQYLTDTEKHTASHMYLVLMDVRDQVLERCNNKSSSQSGFQDIEQTAMLELAGHGFSPEYIEVRSVDDLHVGTTSCQHLRVFAAAILGRARLIDNLPIK